MTPDELKDIKARTDAAIAGPWFAYQTAVSGRFRVDGPHISLGTSLSTGGWMPESEANFIAHARTDVPALLAEVERLQAALSFIAEWDDPAIMPNEETAFLQRYARNALSAK